MTYVLLILTAIGLSIGQVLLKKSANILNQLDNPWELLFKLPFIGGVSVYGLTAIIWIWALKSVPLSRGYMFMSLAFIIVPVMSYYIFQEPLTKHFWVGVALIIAGVFLTIKA